MKRKPELIPHFFSAQVFQARRFYLNLSPPAGTKFAVVCGGVEHCSTNYVIQRDSFPFHSIEYVARGQGTLKLGRRNYELRPGIIFTYGPGIRQHIISSADKPLTKYFVDFAGTQSDQWIHRAGLAPGKVSEVFPPNEIQPLFDELIRSGQRGTQHTPELCRQLLGCLGVKLQEARVPLKSSESPAFATYQACRQLLQENHHRWRTLEEVAKDCQVNAAYLCRLFRRYDHQTPYLFLTHLKMKAAAEQLKRPGALVKNVATELGFTNPFHFSRVFKSVFQISPETFRKMR